MFVKKVSFLSFLTVLYIPVFAQFITGINKTSGALNLITNSSDKHQMNWIFASGDEKLTWHKPEEDWGLGRYDVPELGVKDERWTRITKQKTSGSKTSLVYETRYLEVQVERRPDGQDYLETYTFVNTTGKPLSISGLDIYTPYNDNYPDARIAATNRCNAHVWPGMHSSYVNAIRMNGEGPHLGLVFTKGAMQTYSIANRDRHKDVPFAFSASNTRGVITFNIAPFVLGPKETYTVQWKLFWHTGWDAFYRKAISEGFVKLDASRYAISKNEKLKLSITANPLAGIKKKSITISGDSLGEHTYKITYGSGRKSTMLNYLVVSSPQNLIDKRVEFIVRNQQMNNANDPRYGAYMVYDNDADTIFTDIKRSVAPSDKDEGRERLGMGVLIAKWLQTHQDEAIRNSLMRYVRFVREKLQTSDYKLYSTVDHKSRHRGYNYPWVAHLYLETYNLTKDKRYLADFSRTLFKYFKEFGYKHYSIDFRVTDGLAALEQAAMKSSRDSLLDAYTKSADFFVRTGLDYPKHEVTYEQSIVAPAVTFLCEMYQVTKDKKYLDAAKIQLRSLEAFSGKQPDVHLNDIAIRHWDGYWFGKTPTWGDTMPHYWSTLTALAFDRYYQCTGEAAYHVRAKRILENNLLSFKENGKASCAYLYPAYINDQPGKFYDAFANDQDWALVFYKEVFEK